MEDFYIMGKKCKILHWLKNGVMAPSSSNNGSYDLKLVILFYIIKIFHISTSFIHFFMPVQA